MRTRSHGTPALVLLTLALLAALGTLGLSTAGPEPSEPLQPKYRIRRSLPVAAGQAERAARWAREITDYVNGRVPGLEAQLFLEASPAGGTIHWFVDVEDVQRFREQTAALEADPRYNEFVSRADGLFTDSPRDAVMTAIP